MNIPVTKATLARLTVLSMAGFSAATVIPAYDDASAATINISIAAVYAVVAGVILSSVIRRRANLFDSVRLELNKLRRLYHISKNLAAGSPDRFRGWFTDLHGHLNGYLTHFAGKDFDVYDSSNGAFRKLSYHVYTMPEVQGAKEAALYEDVLRTTGTIAEARQRIKELWDNRLSGHVWTVLLLLTAAFVISTGFATSDTVGGRTAAGAAFAVALLVIDLIWEADTLVAERKGMAQRYADNLAKLELKRD